MDAQETILFDTICKVLNGETINVVSEAPIFRGEVKDKLQVATEKITPEQGAALADPNADAEHNVVVNDFRSYFTQFNAYYPTVSSNLLQAIVKKLFEDHEEVHIGFYGQAFYLHNNDHAVVFSYASDENFSFEADYTETIRLQ